MWRRLSPTCIRNLTEANRSLESSEYSKITFSGCNNTYILFIELIWVIFVQDSFSPTGLGLWYKLSLCRRQTHGVLNCQCALLLLGILVKNWVGDDLKSSETNRAFVLFKALKVTALKSPREMEFVDISKLRLWLRVLHSSELEWSNKVLFRMGNLY